MKQIVTYVWPILLCFVIGLSANYFQSQSLEEWYPLLNKPSVTPPNIAFPIAWGIIYVTMGISLARLIIKQCPPIFIMLWVLQLILNFLWSIFFFLWRNPLLGLVDILLLDLLVITYILMIYRCDKAASWLFAPYLLWLILATYLNGYIYLFN